MVPKFQGCTVKGKALSVQASRIPRLQVSGFHRTAGFQGSRMNAKVFDYRVPRRQGRTPRPQDPKRVPGFQGCMVPGFQRSRVPLRSSLVGVLQKPAHHS